MKNLSLIINGILAIAVAYLYFLHFGNSSGTTTTSLDNVADSVKVEEQATSVSKILYVDIDTINAKYSYIINQKAAIEKQQKNAEKTLQNKGASLEKEIIAYQKQLQAGELTQQQAMEIEKSLGNKQQSLMEQQQKLADQLITKTGNIQDELNSRIKKHLQVYLDQYQADYILGYTEGANILLTNPKLNITKEVLDQLNATEKNK